MTNLSKIKTKKLAINKLAGHVYIVRKEHMQNKKTRKIKNKLHPTFFHYDCKVVIIGVRVNLNIILELDNRWRVSYENF